MSQKINLRAENEDGRIPDVPACQDHMIGEKTRLEKTRIHDVDQAER